LLSRISTVTHVLVKIAADIAAAFGLLSVSLALFSGAAGGGGRFRRADEPVKYWAILAAGLALSIGLFLIAQ